ncbi:MAG: type IV toxin-antitoxin system AbiEi family antitoxin [Pseudobdellovibrionaceae bacterium]|nr:MAG: type IV toxin-antitoxin system AbiEi family antitoxin [Pseudobdellovibrionaceae bacterium]
MSKINLENYISDLQKNGRSHFIRSEALKACQMSNSSFQAALRELSKKGMLLSPKKEFYAIVPPEYKDRPLPPEHYIDQLMNHLNKTYYVGCLSAAAIHGAAHQQPMEFQVITKGPLRNIELNGIRILFSSKKNISDIPTEKIKTKTGFMNVSTKEVTVCDLVKYVEKSGYLDNVVNTIIEISKDLRARKLGSVSKHFETTVLQRLGYLIDTYSGEDELTRFIHEEVERREPQFIPLAIYSKQKDGKMNEKWKIKVNEVVEADV